MTRWTTPCKIVVRPVPSEIVVTISDSALVAAAALSNRYIPSRQLPDKAIDVLDEAGSRVHITNITVPENILHLEEKLDHIKKKKGQVIKKQAFEEAGRLRDKEKRIKESEESDLNVILTGLNAEIVAYQKGNGSIRIDPTPKYFGSLKVTRDDIRLEL